MDGTSTQSVAVLTAVAFTPTDPSEADTRQAKLVIAPELPVVVMHVVVVVMHLLVIVMMILLSRCSIDLAFLNLLPTFYTT